MRDTPVNLCFACNDKYAPHMAAAIASILEHFPSGRKLFIYVLTSNISTRNKSKICELKKFRNFSISFIDVNKDDFSECPITGYVKYITKETYYRFKIPALLNNVDKVLYLDCDIVALADISPLFDYELPDGKYIGMVPDTDVWWHQERLNFPKTQLYCNAGVMLMDNKKLREIGATKILFDYTKSPDREIQFQDQDVLNIVFGNKIEYLPIYWNVMHNALLQKGVYRNEQEIQLSDAIKRPKIVHFTNPKKPWNFRCSNPYKRRYLQALKKTSFKTTLFKSKVFQMMTLLFIKVYSSRKDYHTKTIKLFGLTIRHTNKFAQITEILAEHKEKLCDLSSKIDLLNNIQQTNRSICNIINSYKCSNSTKLKNKELPYAIFDYDFKDSVNLYNAGDFIQSLAVKKLLQKINPTSDCIYVDRENLSFERRKNFLIVMQGYFAHKLDFFPLPNHLPIYIGIHLNSKAKDYIDELIKTDDRFFENETVGCRDVATKRFFNERGIDAYVSRCLTLTLPKREKLNTQNKIYIVDLPNDIIELLPNELSKNAIICRQRELPHIELREDRFNKAEEILNDYRKNAKLVITSALHCASPCVAMGIPVILINLGNEAERFTSLKNIIPIYTKQDIINGKIDFYNVSAPDIEDLKSLMYKNLSLTIKDAISGGNQNLGELQGIRQKIEEYKTNTWSSELSYTESMDFRTKKMFDLLLEYQTNITSVMDIGCGKQLLKRLLPSTIKYYGIDRLKNSKTTIVADFNNGEFPELSADSAFISGVMEYIYDCDKFVKKIPQSVKYIFVSYVLNESCKQRLNIWVNNFDKNGFEKLFTQNGFKLAKFLPNIQDVNSVFIFERNK